MGEPAELSALDVTRVRQWAQTLVDTVRNDEGLTFDIVGGPMISDVMMWQAMVMAQLERAQVIVDSVSRAALIAKLEQEQFAERGTGGHDPHEEAVRHGWNLGRQSLLRELKDGRL